MKKTLTRAAATSMVVAGTLLAVVSAASAFTAEEICQKGRYDAASKYKQCHDKALGKVFLTNDPAALQPTLSKCRVKYADAWLKLQRRAIGTGSTCDNQRFVDNGDGTVTDNLTGLDWEQTTDDSKITDKDVILSWNAARSFFLAGNAAFSSLNNSFDPIHDCLADQCDWRLPTVAELQTILSEPYPCVTSPCAAPILGPTKANEYWTATTLADNASYAWSVSFVTGDVLYLDKTVSKSVRAVRGGL